MKKKVFESGMTKPISMKKCCLLWTAGSALLDIVLEILSCRSLFKVIANIFTKPYIFLMNVAILMLFTSFVLIVKRKLFAYALPSVLWIIVGVTNTVCLKFRPLPVSASDFRLINEAFSMMKIYMKPWHIAIIVAGLSLTVIGLITLFIKGPKYETPLKPSLIWFAASVVILGSFSYVVGTYDILPRTADTPNELYEKNGFAYNFFKSAGSTGVTVPIDYDRDETDILKEELLQLEDTSGDERPNIIILQLESFFDISWMKGINTSEDPTPNFRKLCEENASGYLFVPSYGGGTSNVEFEVLSGMNLDHFTIGESPYYTLLDKNVLDDSVAFNMKRLGYTAHAIHNYSGLFYKRNIAYANLGFDTFTPVEYMDELEYNSQGFARDKVLPSEIFKAMDSTDGSDFVFVVSVEGHGPYPQSIKPEDFAYYVEADADDLTPEEKAGLTYYASTAKDMDVMIGDLIEQLANYDEKCVLVIYGDHLPAIEFTKHPLTAPNAYTSAYVIWSNYGIEGEDKDIEAYQLTSRMQELIGFNAGILTRYHQTRSEREDYQDNLKKLEYSMTNGKDKAEPSKLVYSTHPIKVTDAVENGGDVIVFGENFTEYSRICINDEVVNTIFQGKSCLISDGIALKKGDKISVAQVTKQGEILESYELTA